MRHRIGEAEGGSWLLLVIVVVAVSRSGDWIVRSRLVVVVCSVSASACSRAGFSQGATPRRL